MFTKKATVAFLALAFMFVMPLAMANGSSGAQGDVSFDDSSVDIGEFNENSPGRLTVILLNHNADESIGDEGAITVNAYITFLNGTDRLDSKENIIIPKREGSDPGSVRVDFNFRIDSPGTYRVTVHVEPEDDFMGSVVGESEEFRFFNSTTYTINVESSIWSNTSTYIVIIIVIIVIIAAILLKLRSNSTGKKKTKDSAGVFTAMEAERKSKSAPVYDEYDDDNFVDEEEVEEVVEKPKAEKPKEKTKSTEKQEYVGKVSSSKSKKSSPQRKSKRR
jgi:Cell division protein